MLLFLDEKYQLTSAPIYLYKFHRNETPLFYPRDQRKVEPMLKSKWTICLLTGFCKLCLSLLTGKVAELGINMEDYKSWLTSTAMFSYFCHRSWVKIRLCCLLSLKERNKVKGFEHGICNVQVHITVEKSIHFVKPCHSCCCWLHSYCFEAFQLAQVLPITTEMNPNLVFWSKIFYLFLLFFNLPSLLETRM